MAKTWYPVIDYSICEDCGSCIDKCTHGVFTPQKAPSPVVANPQSCIDHCHGCGNLCPVGAITYVGDDTSWTPSNSKEQQCKGNDNHCYNDNSKMVQIEYLFLDLKTCDRCIGTDRLLDDVVKTISPALSLAGYTVDYQKIEIDTPNLAIKHQFSSSPTIRINGKDIGGEVKENSCDCCSEISGTDVNCRVFTFQKKDYEVPPKEMLAETILKAAFDQNKPCCWQKIYELPENLKTFFEGKKNKTECSCEGKCCQ